ncbi:MAG: biliverdin-producing heme oxygenase [Phycisphaeraceae bacterium]|nr:biliverdin-producing heme oxygenase [Phycisphaeraceae bacterium]MCW5754462.1 biliverdin-producing heme oxygenase [Phycisphaeraceae bacterium]
MTTSVDATARPATQRLREETRDLHTAAEKGPYQAAMVMGRLPRAGYVAMLEQMLLVHRALEAGLERARAGSPAIARVVTREQYQEPYLLEDLAYFGIDPDAIEATGATRALVEEIERASNDPLTLLGMHYVLEGSNNGNRFIAKALMKAYDLTPPDGLCYMLPYGERQPEVWSAFKTNLDACGLGDEEVTTLVRAAEAMYRGIIAIHASLQERMAERV